MTGKYTIKELHEISGLDIATLRQRSVMLKIPFTWILTGKNKKTRTKLLKLNEKTYKMIINPNRLTKITEEITHVSSIISESEKYKIKELMTEKCRHGLALKQEQWMILLGFFPLPKIKARASYIHKGEV